MMVPVDGATIDDDARPSPLPLDGATDECTDKTKLFCQALAPTSEVVCSHWAHLHPQMLKLLLQELAKNSRRRKGKDRPNFSGGSSQIKME